MEEILKKLENIQRYWFCYGPLVKEDGAWVKYEDLKEIIELIKTKKI